MTGHHKATLLSCLEVRSHATPALEDISVAISVAIKRWTSVKS